jgi:hypothetical protein
MTRKRRRRRKRKRKKKRERERVLSKTKHNVVRGIFINGTFTKLSL